MIIAAGENASCERITDAPFRIPGPSGFLHDNGIDTIEVFRMHVSWKQSVAGPAFRIANSDYRPPLDVLTFKATIMEKADSFDKVNALRRYCVPVIDILENRLRAGPSPYVNDGPSVRG